MKQLVLLFALVLALVGCSGRTEEVETGYKGEARINSWLAAQRFLEHYEYGVEPIGMWRPPTSDDGVWFIPADVVSNDLFAGQLSEWVAEGGHLVCLVEHAGMHNDWLGGGRPVSKLEPAFAKLLEKHGFSASKASTIAASSTAPTPPVPATGRSTRNLRFNGGVFETEIDPKWLVSYRGGPPDALVSSRVGSGRLTVLTDASLFRNRYIDGHQHAALLLALVDASNGGQIVFVRGAALSLWALLMERAWAVMIGLVVVILFWLWKNLGRFGPMEAVDAPSNLRGYDHHLEALGDFQWRLDKGATMLGPLRAEILERAHRLMTKSGRLDDDIFALLAERVGIPRERAFRALAEPAPADAGVFTRTSADLQAILKSLP